ncbi:MAG: YlxR family protein [SAR202 cluster bacterium]|nr:YlxR family protein [SAR202 cluster bacterium]
MADRARHVPLRTCVICGRKGPKRGLARVVASADGAVQTDRTGKLPGRGAYVCGDGSCLHIGIKRGRLEHALRTGLNDKDWAEVIESVQALSGPL